MTHLHNPLPTMKKAYEHKAEKHRHMVWTATGLLSIAAVCFALELLAPAGVLGVLGTVIQGVDAD